MKFGSAVLAYWAGAGRADEMVLSVAVIPLSTGVDALHRLVLWICVGVTLVLYAVMFYSILAHRRSKGVVPAPFHKSTLVEVLWSAVPLVILVAMAVPAMTRMDAVRDGKPQGYTHGASAKDAIPARGGPIPGAAPARVRLVKVVESRRLARLKAFSGG
ncbi:MAG: cytochrome c oxidase subunit II transmembrane domain-containing protein [Gammaproteobacteria bacterium]